MEGSRNDTLVDEGAWPQNHAMEGGRYATKYTQALVDEARIIKKTMITPASITMSP